MQRLEDSPDVFRPMRGSARGDLRWLRRHEEYVAGGVVDGLGGFAISASGNAQPQDSQTKAEFIKLQNAVIAYLKAHPRLSSESYLLSQVPSRKIVADGVIGMNTFVAVRAVAIDITQRLGRQLTPPSSINELAKMATDWTLRINSHLQVVKPTVEQPQAPTQWTNAQFPQANYPQQTTDPCAPGYVGRLACGQRPAEAQKEAAADQLISEIAGKAPLATKKLSTGTKIWISAGLLVGAFAVVTIISGVRARSM